MVTLLNVLPFLIVLICFYFYTRDARKHKGTDKVGKSMVKWALVALAAILILKSLSFGIVGKPVGDKLPVPKSVELEEKVEAVAPIRDVQRKPVTKTDEEFNALTDWKNKDKAPVAAPAPVEAVPADTSTPLPLPPAK